MGYVIKNTETGEVWGPKFSSEESARKQARFLNEQDDNSAD